MNVKKTRFFKLGNIYYSGFISHEANCIKLYKDEVKKSEQFLILKINEYSVADLNRNLFFE